MTVEENDYVERLSQVSAMATEGRTMNRLWRGRITTRSDVETDGAVVSDYSGCGHRSSIPPPPPPSPPLPPAARIMMTKPNCCYLLLVGSLLLILTMSCRDVEAFTSSFPPSSTPSSSSLSSCLSGKHSATNSKATVSAVAAAVRSTSQVFFPTGALKRTQVTRLYHGGHSHSHHDHHHHNSGDKKNANESSLSWQEQFQIPSRSVMIRKFAWILICWGVTFGPALWSRYRDGAGTVAAAAVAAKSRVIQPSHWTKFLVLSGIMWVLTDSTKQLKSTYTNTIRRFQSFYSGLQRHHGRPTVSAILTQPSESSVEGTTPLRSTSTGTGIFAGADDREADRVTWIGVVVNSLLSVGKLFVGITQNSSVLIADAGHSLSDLVSDFITLWSVSVARLPPDDDHPYGHSKFEAIGSLFLSLTLLATAGSVGWHSNQQLLQILSNPAVRSASSVAEASIPVPGLLALFMAGLSILSKEWLFRLTREVGQRLNSPVVLANAWHHRSDAYSSVLALGSIAFAMSGFPAADAAAGILVAVMIGTTGGDILVESVQQLSDSANEELQTRIASLLKRLNDDDVTGITSIRARTAGSAANVDVVVETSPDLSTTATRAVEERVRQYLIYKLTSDGADGGRLAVTATIHAKPNIVFGPPCPLILNQHLRGKGLSNTEDGFDHASHSHDISGTTERRADTDDPEASCDEAFGSNDTALQFSSTNSSPVMPAGISAAQVEHQVRQQALLMYPKIESVQGVTVHYSTPTSVTVDVNINVDLTLSSKMNSSRGSDPGSITDLSLTDIRQCALELKQSLESQSPEIMEARIFLDLNTPKRSAIDTQDSRIGRQPLPATS